MVHDVTAGPSRGPVGIGRPTRRSGRGCEAYPEGREKSESPPRGLGWVRRPNRKPRIGRQSITEVWEGSGVHFGGLDGPSNPPCTFGWASDPYRPLPDLQLGFLSSLDPPGVPPDPPGPLDGLSDPS